MWIFPQQVFNFSESFYAPPVVLVTVNHHYDSHNAHSVRPEVNALSTWADVSFFQTTSNCLYFVSPFKVTVTL